MSEVRKLYAVLALLLVYGLSSVFTIGSFVLPLPLFEIFLLVLILSFVPNLWKTRKLETVLFTLYGLLTVFSRTYNYQFILGDQNLELLDKSIVPDLALLLSHLALLSLAVFFFKREKPAPLYFTLACFSYIIAAIFNFDLLLLPLFLFVIVYYQKADKLFSQANSFWLYPSLFLLLRVGTLLLFGSI
jgi:hypothetical protein